MKKPKSNRTPKRYAPTAKTRLSHAADGRNRSVDARDIASKMTDTRDMATWTRCEHDLRAFCETYLTNLFPLKFSPDHLTIIDRLQRAIIEGGQFAMACPRGHGKTTLVEAAALWALLYAHRRFLFVVASDEDAGLKILTSIKSELETNDMLDRDFWEMIRPIRSLEGISHRCRGQHDGGHTTAIGWRNKELVLPTIHRKTPGCKASGAIVRCAGILGRVRGARGKTADGDNIRPDFVLVDDPSTDESGRSPSQNDQRLGVLNGAVLGLAGPGKKISAVATVTVIQNGDLADQLLDRAKHPDWQGLRIKLMPQFPTDMLLWAKYNDLRVDSLKADGTIKLATEFYRENREAMDAGAQVSWADRYNPDELSAIQHAMNLYFRDERSFQSEYQNQPMTRQINVHEVPREAITANQSALERGQAELATEHITAFIDIQKEALFWMVCGWSSRFDGLIMDYGVFPDQQRRNFTLSDIRKTLSKEFPGMSLEARLFKALRTVVGDLTSREFVRDDGTIMRCELVMIDANWGDQTDTVYAFCRQAGRGGIWPSHGRYVGAASMPFSQYRIQPGERAGLNWRIPSSKGKRAVRHVLFDTNFWKSFVRARLTSPEGQAGHLAVFKGSHELLADHLTSEIPISVEGCGRQLEEWKIRAKAIDNHWWDCLVGSAVGASMLGCSLDLVTASDPTVAGEAMPGALPMKSDSAPQPRRQQRQRVRYMNEQTNLGCVL